MGVLAFDVAPTEDSSLDRRVRESATRLYEDLVRALQQDASVRWSPPHEELPPPRNSGLARRAQLIVGNFVSGRVRLVDDEFVCDVRVISVGSGEELTGVTVRYRRSGEADAATSIAGQIVTAVVSQGGEH